MNRKLLALISAAGLIVVAASSGSAVARTPAFQCRSASCLFKLSGRALELNFGGSRIRCASVTGKGSFDRVSGSSVLDLQGCREGVTVFGFRCSDSVARGGPVRTAPMGTEVKWGSEKEPKVVFLGLRATFRCSGAMSFYVEGFLVGHLDRSQCNGGASEYQLEPVLFAHGGIGNEPAYDIYVDANVETYKVPTPWQMQFGRDVTLEC